MDPGEVEVRMVGVAKLTPAIVKKARQMVRTGEANMYQLARDAGVTRQAMTMAVRGETWQALDGEEPPVPGRNGLVTPARPKVKVPRS